VTVISDPLFYALAVPAVIALGLSKGGFVGVGQIGTPLLALLMPPLEAAAILLPIMLVAGRGLGLGLSARTGADAFWRHAAGRHRRDWRGLAAGRVYFRLHGAHRHRRHHHPVSALQLETARGCWRKHSARPSRLRGTCLGDRVRLHLDAVPGPAARRFRCTCCRRTWRDDLRRTTGVFFAAVNVLKVVPLFRARQVSRPQAWAPAGAAAAGDCTNFLGFWVVRITPQALFLQDHHGADVGDRARAHASGVTDMLRG